MKQLDTHNEKYSISLKKDDEDKSTYFNKIKTRFEGLSDSDIWDKFRNSDSEAFVFIYYTYYPILYNYGHQLSSNTELVEDCIHEVFIDIHRTRARLSNTNSIKFYLIKSLKTKYLRTIKNTSRTKANEQHYDGYEFQFSMSAEEKIINAQLNEELLDKLNMALSALTDRQREVIYYFFYENLTIDEIAVIMEVSNRRTIQNLIYRSISFLREHIDINSLVLLLYIFARTKSF